MCECPECGKIADEESVEFNCPSCGKDDWGEGYYICENCETYFARNDDDDAWRCEFCGYMRVNGIEKYYHCPECGEEVCEEDKDNICPNCGHWDPDDTFYTCPVCGTLFDYRGDYWKCRYCKDDEDEDESRCPGCGQIWNGNYCYRCNWPNNQGWIGEHYG